VGFDVNHRKQRDVDLDGLGLESMKERTEHVGGIFEVSSTPGAGAAIRAAWTLEAAETDPCGPPFTPRDTSGNGPNGPRT
jgi:signal transduction histidine kinase